MMKKTAISIVIVLLMLATLIPTVYADDSTVTLTANDVTMSGGMITKYLGEANPLYSTKNIIIPETIGGVTVTGIGLAAFAQVNMTSVTIPNTVTYIGSFAFQDNALTSITLPPGLIYLGGSAFRLNGLTSVTIPDTVTYIGGMAFDYNHSSFTTFRLPDTGRWKMDSRGYTFDFKGGTTVDIYHGYINEYYIDPELPSGCYLAGQFAYRKLSDSTVSIYKYVPNDYATFADNVDIPQTLDGYRVISLEDDAFRGEDYAAVVIPEGVTSIGDHAFYNSLSLECVTLPSSITSLGDYAFDSTPLTNLYYAGNEAKWNALLKGTINEIFVYADYGNETQSAVLQSDHYDEDVETIHIHFTGTTVTSKSATFTAVPTASNVTVDGTKIAFDAYNINGNNYFKLRDLAYVLSNTPKQFAVDWNMNSQTIVITSYWSYKPVGVELLGKGSSNKTAIASDTKIIINDVEVGLTAYNIDGSNYFKLRDIGQALDFGTDWDSVSKTIVINTSKGYTSE